MKLTREDFRNGLLDEQIDQILENQEKAEKWDQGVEYYKAVYDSEKKLREENKQLKEEKKRLEESFNKQLEWNILNSMNITTAKKAKKQLRQYKNLASEIEKLKLCVCGHEEDEHEHILENVGACDHLNTDRETYCPCNEYQQILENQEKAEKWVKLFPKEIDPDEFSLQTIIEWKQGFDENKRLKEIVERINQRLQDLNSKDDNDHFWVFVEGGATTANDDFEKELRKILGEKQ